MNKGLALGLAILVLAGAVGAYLVTVKKGDDVLKRLPAGCSGKINASESLPLQCVAGESKVTQITFGNTTGGELTSEIKCGITVVGTSDQMIAPQVVVQVFDESGTQLGSGRIASFFAKEVNSQISKTVDDSITFPKGKTPVYFTILKGPEQKGE